MAPKRKAVKKLTKAQIMKLMHGKGFFGDLWSGIKRVGSKIGDFAKDKLTKPSTYLGIAGMLPTPLAPALKASSFITGLAGKGRKRVRRGGARAPKSGVIRM
jgi:hypothetical protein